MTSQTDETAAQQDILARVTKLAEACDSFSAELSIGGFTLRVSKGAVGSSLPVGEPATDPGGEAIVETAGGPKSAELTEEHGDCHRVFAQASGTFYRAPSPGAQPFCKPGDRIGKDDTIGLIEAMKLFNSVPSGVAGEVVLFLVEDAQPVAEGEPLALVRERAEP